MDTTITPLAEQAPGVAALLREATDAQHRTAESRPFMTALMGGELDLAAYTLYLAQFARIYAGLESRETVRSDPAVLQDRRLDRAAAIEADLAALGAPDWRDTLPALPATIVYEERLRALARDEPLRLVAHHYTRYLGDLSGGQVMATMLRRHYGATEDQLSYFRFDALGPLVPYKRGYRDALDALDLTDAERDALVAEARAAFDANTAVFDDLQVATAGR
ncbi:heme oxygenase (biliverdin-producing) [Labedella endophytica]|uniref:heme oxygenase (biliverdin-producing) n=1 Tax=Labedella endophytica TaxID=1523160 RepID=A0A3S0VS78_9MICO|nr:biliverdin-producing heme oxygenase [Labedella endophytica]RUQ99067.1 biliverdin-producing heme oxygenase [Labedella endophytica]